LLLFNNSYIRTICHKVAPSGYFVTNMENCIFCKIGKGEIPCYKLYEDESFLAFLDINPRNPGHTLIVPKEHFRWVWDVTNIGAYYEVVQQLAVAIKKALNADMIFSFVFGEEVPHAHVWLVPRFENDGHGSSIDLSLIKKIENDEMIEIQNKIIKCLE